MLKLTICAVTFFSVCTFTSTNVIPKFIKPCKISEPTFEKCAIESGYYALPFIIKGDRQYNIPNLKPLKIDKLHFDAGFIQADFDNMEIMGLENTEILGIKIDTTNQTMFFSIKIPRVDIKSHYITKGRILIFPIEGNGQSDIAMENGIFNCTVYLDNFRPDSTKPIVLKKSEIIYTGEDIEYHFDNLFNGNKQIGDNVNKVLNENRESIRQDFRPFVAETINTVMQKIVNGIIKDMYFKDAFF